MSVFNKSDKAAGQPDIPKTASGEPAAAQPAKAQVASTTAPIVVPPTTGVSLISKALKITGQLESSEDIHIEGQVDGDVRGLSVIVGSGAKVKGTVCGESVEVSGTVDGRIEAKKVTLSSKAHMSGDVLYQEIKIESGAFIDGHLTPSGKA